MVSPLRLSYLFTPYKIHNYFLPLLTPTTCLGPLQKEKSEILLLEMRISIRAKMKRRGPTHSLFLFTQFIQQQQQRKTHFFTICNLGWDSRFLNCLQQNVTWPTSQSKCIPPGSCQTIFCPLWSRGPNLAWSLAWMGLLPQLCLIADNKIKCALQRIRVPIRWNPAAIRSWFKAIRRNSHHF